MTARIALLAAANLLAGLSGRPATAAGLHLEQETDAVRLDTRSFFFARYATVGASTLYAAYGFGKAGVFFGMVENPRSGYSELIGGGFARIAWKQHDVIVGLAAADASDSLYLQAYLTPSLAIGPLSLSGTLEWYEPLESAGTRQLDLNPFTALIRIGPRLRAGGMYTLGYSAGSPLRHRAGPAVEVLALGCALKLELVRNVARSSDEVRIVVAASF